MPNVTELLHNNVIPYNAIKLRMPNRQAFLALPEVKAVDDIIKAKSQLMFLPTYLMETHMQDVKYEKALYKIILMGVLRDGRRVNVILDDINPYFEVQLPSDFSGPVRYLGPNKTFVKYMDYEYREILQWYTNFYDSQENPILNNFYPEDTQEEHKERMYIWVEQLRFASRGRIRSSYIVD
jgi:hypothetical protein